MAGPQLHTHNCSGPTAGEVPAEPLELNLPRPVGKSVEENSPYRITDGTSKKTDDPSADIAIMDNPLEQQVTLGEGVTLVASHCAKVQNAFGDHPIRTAFDVSLRGNPERNDPNKVRDVLIHILNNHESEGIKVVNRSFGKAWTFDRLNALVKTYAPSEMQPKELTPENVGQYSALILKALDNYPADQPDSPVVQEVVLEALILKKLIKAGVAVVDSAGNDGPTRINIVHALVPDLVVSGGLDGDAPHPASSRSSLIDHWGPFSHEFRVPGYIVKYEGTSLSAPHAAIETSALMKEGLSIEQINAVLRERSEQKMGHAIDTIVIPDALSVWHGRSDLTTNTSALAFLDVVDRIPALPLEEALRVLEIAGKHTSALAHECHQVETLFETYASLNDDERNLMLQAIQLREEKAEDLQDLVLDALSGWKT